MPLEHFSPSLPLTLGVELELQLVNTHDYNLAPYAMDMLRLMEKQQLPGSVVPEMTRSMIEVSTGICHSASEVLSQLTPIRSARTSSTSLSSVVAPTRFRNGTSSASTTSHAFMSCRRCMAI